MNRFQRSCRRALWRNALSMRGGSRVLSVLAKGSSISSKAVFISRRRRVPSSGVARAASSLARFAFLRFWGCRPEKSKSMIFSPINTVTSRVTAPAIHNAVERLICFPLYRRLRRPLFCSSGKISSGVLPKTAQVMAKVRKPPTTMAMQYRRKSTGLPSGATL